MSTPRFIDASTGNPALPFTALARRAFGAAQKDMARYHIPDTRYSECSVRPFLYPVAEHFYKRGFKETARSYGIPEKAMALSGGGTTALFDGVVRALVRDVEMENREKKRAIKPAIVMPVPTYGIFFENAKHAGLHIIKVVRRMDEGGRLDRGDLHAAVERAHDDGYRIVAYYDSNPHNPLGLVRGRAETEDIATYFQSISLAYAVQDKQEAARRPEAEWGRRSVWYGPAARIKLIDDMVYDGLVYDNAQQPWSFAQIPDVFNDTIVLAGLSKIGLVGLRAGVAFGNRDVAGAVADQLQSNVYCPNAPALHALSLYFNDTARSMKEKAAHLAQLNETHRYGGVLMKTLINGLENVPEASAQDIERMTGDVQVHAGVDRKSALARLQHGIRLVRVVTTPQAGFFHLIDFSRLRGRYYDRGDAYQSFANRIRDFYDVYHTLGKRACVRLAADSWMGLDGHMVGRASFALPVADIVTFCERVDAMVKMTGKQKAPARQPAIR